MKQSTHEVFTRDEVAQPGSDRTFGLVMAGALALVSLLNGWHLGRVWPWTFAASVLLLIAALSWPSSLHPLNRLWMKLGLILHRIVNPIVMGGRGEGICCGSSARLVRGATGSRAFPDPRRKP